MACRILVEYPKNVRKVPFFYSFAFVIIVEILIYFPLTLTLSLRGERGVDGKRKNEREK